MKQVVRTILLIVVAALLTMGMLWSRNKAMDQACKSLQVEVVNDDSTTFVTPQGVVRLVDEGGISPVGKPMWHINCDAIERLVLRNDYVETAECYKDETTGVVHLRVKQIVPVMRVFDGEQSYYVNSSGKRIRATEAFVADVPVVEGHFTRKFPPTRLLPMIEYVQGDATLNSLVSMYCMRDTSNIFVIPTIRGHVINMGGPDGFQNKFRKLLLFYRKVMPHKGWMAYDTISLKWDHQVVATRRYEQQKQAEAIDPNDDEPTPDIETMTTGVATSSQAPQASKAENDEPQPAKSKTSEVRKVKPKVDDREQKADAKSSSKAKTADKTKKERQPEKKAANKSDTKAAAKSKTTTKNKKK